MKKTAYVLLVFFNHVPFLGLCICKHTIWMLVKWTIIIILQVCTINYNYMMYGSWDMEHDRHNFLSFRTIFCSFTPLTTQKIKTLKKWKKSTWRYYHFTKVCHKWQSHDVWFLRDWAWQSHFGLFFAFYPPNNMKNQNFEKIKKKHLEILSFYICVP